jgi:hypothetical protein
MRHVMFREPGSALNVASQRVDDHKALLTVDVARHE